jgi:uncharacterized membrane protein YbhN (UPF0104 family)
MQVLAALAALLGLELDALIARIKQNAVAYGALAFCAVVALVFILVAVEVALSWWVGPVWAPLIIAAVFLLAALGVWLWAQAAERERRRKQEERRRSAEATALASSAALTALPVLRRFPWIGAAVLPIAAAAGYAWYRYQHRTGNRR